MLIYYLDKGNKLKDNTKSSRQSPLMTFNAVSIDKSQSTESRDNSRINTEENSRSVHKIGNEIIIPATNVNPCVKFYFRQFQKLTKTTANPFLDS